MRVLNFSIAVFAFLFISAESTRATAYGLIVPTTEQPLHVESGESFSVRMSIPIALTPPPGVQKASVWRDWRVVLQRRVPAVYKTKDHALRYHMRFLKIRPSENNLDYVVTAQTQRWLPSGRYDLNVQGPGFSYSAAASVLVGDVQPEDDNISVSTASASSWRFHITPGVGSPRWIELIVGKSIPGVAVSLNGASVPIADIFWASFKMRSRMRGDKAEYTGTADGRRLIRVALPSDYRAGVVTVSQRKKATQNQSTSVRIIPAQTEIQPMEWVEIRGEMSFKPLKAIWLFADGENAVGLKTTYRWMVTTEAVAELTVFDGWGTPHRARMKKPLQMPLARNSSGCGCRMVNEPHVSILRFVFNTCFETILLLLE
ncbi:MAG: hypothetical protein JXX29_02740 [Deltaproteobacteria bacterium]|nr:hypothetical protein [Deltaproteobacteria bacterium]MBN2670559.1 hypothetical protein [Deltaproteobacteria bacterium]